MRGSQHMVGIQYFPEQKKKKKGESGFKQVGPLLEEKMTWGGSPLKPGQAEVPVCPL